MEGIKFITQHWPVAAGMFAVYCSSIVSVYLFMRKEHKSEIKEIRAACVACHEELKEKIKEVGELKTRLEVSLVNLAHLVGSVSAFDRGGKTDAPVVD